MARQRQRQLQDYFGSGQSSSPPKSSPMKSSPVVHQKRSRAVVSSSESDSDNNVQLIKFEKKNELIVIDNEESDTASPKRRQQTTRLRKKSDSEEEVESSDHEAVIPAEWKPRQKKAVKKIVASDDDEPKKKRRLTKGERPPTPEDDEVDEDLIISSRMRDRRKKSAYERNLEKIKKRKQGQVSESSGSSKEDEEEADAVPFHGARSSCSRDRSSSSASENEVEPDQRDELDNFIVDDSADAPTVDLPAAFSMGSYQDLTHHFKTVCQLFVHLSVRPPDEREDCMEKCLKDEYFAIPLSNARRQLIGLRDSSVTSQVWKQTFVRALKLYPNFDTTRMDFTVPGCDACNMGGRTSTLLTRVSGKAYSPKGFEPIEDSDLESDYDSEGEQRTAKFEFHLGRFCATRARVYHQLTHWEHILFRALDQEVTTLRERKDDARFVRVGFAGGIPPPDDLTDADGLTDWLDSRQIIQREWNVIKRLMDGARKLELEHKRGGGTDN